MRLSIVYPMIATLTLGVGASIAGQAAEAKCVPPSMEAFRSMTPAEIQLLLADVGKTNPTVLNKLREDPERRRDQVENLRELFAFASQAIREGLASRTVDCNELDFIRDEVTAVTYDIEKRGRAALPFGLITEAKVAAFWGSGAANRTPLSVVEAREARFKKFLDTKVALMADGTPMKDGEITGEERKVARDFFAKIGISAEEFVRSKVLSKTFRDKVALQLKLQQAQFLARQYNEVATEKTSPTSAEIESFVKARPELDPAAKRLKAEGILRRARSGEDFAKLANEFSDDPGNSGDAGKKHGGLYADVPAGRMIEAFEKAALSLEPGQVHPELTTTDFGYHVIKLEKKGFGGVTYDVRHILISTGYKDPDDPAASEVPVTEYVRSKIQDEKSRKLMARLAAENAISVPDDFEVPQATKTAPARKVKPKAKSPARKRN